MNAVKLAKLGLPKVQHACITHAEKAITYRDRGNTRMFELHCDLLDQCAVVARVLKALQK